MLRRGLKVIPHPTLSKMAPIQLEPHSCQHCRRLVINEEQVVDKERGEEKNFHHFEFFLSDIITGSVDDCALCTWLLDAELG
jgi:hypothetical protein